MHVKKCGHWVVLNVNNCMSWFSSQIKFNAKGCGTLELLDMLFILTSVQEGSQFKGKMAEWSKAQR